MPTHTLESLMQAHPLKALAPELTLALFAVLVLLAGAFLPEEAQKRTLPALALIGAAVSAFASYALWNLNMVFGPEATATFAADNFALYFNWIFLFGLAVAVLISPRFLAARSGDRHTVVGEYYALLMLSTLGMMMVAGARDLLVIFLGIETLSIALYVLAGFARARLMSNEAALKYFLLGAFATGFLLYGIALTYYATESTHLLTIRSNITNGVVTGEKAPILYVAIALLLIGLGFKAALVPFHQWTPDVYEGSPTPVTGFMAVGAKAAAFAALLRVFPGALGAPDTVQQWFNIMIVVAVLTMTVGNIVAIGQNSLKRMLAYSSIAHAGYALMGVLATGNAVRNGSDATIVAQANAGVIFYLVTYAVMNLGAFATLVYLENARDSHTAGGEAADTDALDSEDGNLKVDDLRGLAWRHPLAAAALTVFLFSLAGVPPTAGFFGKLYIFTAALNQNLLGLVIVGALNTVISVYYYLRPVISMYAADSTAASELEGTAAIEVNASGTATAVPALVGGRSLAVTITVAICVVAVLGMIALQGPVFGGAVNASPFFDKAVATSPVLSY